MVAVTRRTTAAPRNFPAEAPAPIRQGRRLVALRESSAAAQASGAFQRGIQYLLNSQLADGSWYVASRAVPFQLYFDSDFPHGPDQFISAAASNWLRWQG